MAGEPTAPTPSSPASMVCPKRENSLESKPSSLSADRLVTVVDDETMKGAAVVSVEKICKPVMAPAVETACAPNCGKILVPAMAAPGAISRSPMAPSAISAAPTEP